MVKLLVVDWDYFFEDKWGSGSPDSNLYDWGHKEASFFIDQAWMPRAVTFLMNGLPLPGLTGEQASFWDRVKFNPGAQLYYGDSNARAVTPEVAEGVTEVLLLDAHHDSGYAQEGDYSFKMLQGLVRAGRWHCDNWMVFYYCVGAMLKLYYPRWKEWAFKFEPGSGLGTALRRSFDPGGPIEGVDRVYVCRSGAWVPPWLDPDFLRFVNTPEVAMRVGLEPDPIIREWSTTDVEQQAAAWTALRKHSESTAR